MWLFKKKGKKKISEIKNIEIFDPNFEGKGGVGGKKSWPIFFWPRKPIWSYPLAVIYNGWIWDMIIQELLASGIFFKYAKFIVSIVYSIWRLRRITINVLN